MLLQFDSLGFSSKICRATCAKRSDDAGRRVVRPDLAAAAAWRARAALSPRPPAFFPARSRRASRQQPKHGADAAAPSFMKVVHAGGVHIRAAPHRADPEGGELLPQGTVVACVPGRAIASEAADGQSDVVVEIAHGRGFLVARRGALTVLEACAGPTEVEGAWWYRVVHPDGMSFLTAPAVDAPRGGARAPAGAVVKGVRKHTVGDALVTFVQLADDPYPGWVLEATHGGELLERFDGCALLEAVSSEARAQTRARDLARGAIGARAKARFPLASRSSSPLRTTHTRARTRARTSPLTDQHPLERLNEPR